ncbi:DUF3784 domain-containing protein [Flavobacterium eburneipallidum]|uniref:DUF3784 domain-containing protein n=1 Tax=Flavobacterium eburneipallidum TaxID=3003263 RepID=UPI0032C4620A
MAIGFIVTENNAKYLLSGYNTMKEEDRQKFDIKSYIPYFRKFHLFLGISYLVLGLLITYLINEEVGGIFLGIYPILAYGYFMWSSRKFSKNINTKWNKLGIYILIAALIFVIGMMYSGVKEDKLIVHPQSIEFTGSYSETLNQNEIQNIALVKALPNIVRKTHGFAVGKIRKGYFKTDQDEVIKLIINEDKGSYILFTKTNGKKVYFSSKEKSNESILNEIKKKLPEIEYQ